MRNLLSSRLLSENLKIRIYRTIILPVAGGKEAEGVGEQGVEENICT